MKGIDKAIRIRLATKCWKKFKKYMKLSMKHDANWNKYMMDAMYYDRVADKLMEGI